MEAGLRNLSSQLLISRSLAPRHITLTSLSSSSPHTIFIMFARVAAVATLFALPILAAAGSCNTGSVQCCNSLEDVSRFVLYSFATISDLVIRRPTPLRALPSLVRLVSLRRASSARLVFSALPFPSLVLAATPLAPSSLSAARTTTS